MNRFLAVLGLILVSACSTPLLLSETDIPARLQQLISEREYRRTLTVIDSVKPESALYSEVQQLRQEVLKSIENYDAEVVRKTTAFSKKNQWQQAEQLFDEALDQLPENSRSHQLYQQFIEQRSRYISEQQLKLNILLGEQMVEEGEYRTNIHNANPSSWSAGWALKKYRSRRKEVAEYLANQGLVALDEDSYGNAQKYLQLSHQLVPDENVQLALEKIKGELNARWSKHLQKQQQRYQILVNEYKTALAGRDFAQARELLAKLTGLNPKDESNKAHQQQLDVAIEQEIQKMIARGEVAYTEGNVKLALEVWKSATRFSPDHPELLKHIDRAERFIENYESLK